MFSLSSANSILASPPTNIFNVSSAVSCIKVCPSTPSKLTLPNEPVAVVIKLPLALTSPSTVNSLVGFAVNKPTASALSSRNIACVLSPD